jgi:chromate transporter
VNAVLKGMGVGVAAVVADVTITMAKNIFGEKSVLSVFIMLLAFAAVFVFRVDVKIIILFGAVLGLGSTFYYKKRGKEQK